MARVICDLCRNVDAVVFCRADSAALCTACDSEVHQANKVASLHKRVPISNICELSLADSTCKAGIAGLGVAKEHPKNMYADPASPIVPSIVAQYVAQNCIADGVEQKHDVDVNQHRQNAAHHEIVGSLHAQDMDLSLCTHSNTDNKVPDLLDILEMGIIQPEFRGGVVSDEFYACWQMQEGSKLFECSKDDGDCADQISDEDLMGWKEENFHFVESLLLSEPRVEGNTHVHDCLVPSLECTSFIACNVIPTHEARSSQEILSQLTSTMGMSTVPDMVNCMSAINTPPSLHHIYHPCNSIAREARVLKYKEKRKNRNFEKIVRYASRKACAEARPRVNGRFAKGPFELFMRQAR